MNDREERAVVGIERQAKAVAGLLRDLTAEVRNVTRALSGIHEAVKDSNRARDRWAREVLAVLDDAKGEAGADEDSG